LFNFITKLIIVTCVSCVSPGICVFEVCSAKDYQ